MTWIALIKSNLSDNGIGFVFHNPASRESIAAAEAALGAAFPASFRELLLECNGVTETLIVEGKEEPEPIHLLLYDLETIQAWHDEDVDDEGSIAPTVYTWFADAGNGIRFGFDQRRNDDAVFGWWPIENDIQQLAPTLEAFLKGWLSGEISV